MFGSFLPSALGWFGSHQSLPGYRSRHCHGINFTHHRGSECYHLPGEGRSESSGFFCFFVGQAFFSRRVATVATLPSAPFEERFSLGASWVFSFQPVLPPDYRPLVHLCDGSWARRLTQSPELGFGLLLFLSKNVFDFMQPPALLSDCCCATVRRLLHPPTSDAAKPQAFSP